MLYDVIYTSAFKRKLSKLNKEGRDLKLLDKIIVLLRRLEYVGLKYHDQFLVNPQEFGITVRCLRLEDDWHLVYMYDHDNEEVVIAWTGDGSELW